MSTLHDHPHDDVVADPDRNSTRPDTAVTSTTELDQPVTRRRVWPVVATAVAVVGVAGVVYVAADPGGDGSAEVDDMVEPNTVTAEVGDLISFTELDGRMTYADTTVVTAAADGLVTAVIAEGDVVERGSTVAEVDGRPVAAFVGDVPLYRPLAEGAVGDDVLIVESNLASLGHHTELDDDGEPVDEQFVVDGVWDEATTAAVGRWQDDLGVEVTGQIQPSDVAVIAGTAEVIDVAVAIGDRTAPGAPLVELTTLTELDATHAAHGGDLELLVAEGDTIAAGDVVYSADDLPITAVVAPDGIDEELRRGDEGDDVLAVESMLVGLGYDATGELVVDGDFDEATETAVTEWQEDLRNTWEDVRVDGRIGPDDLLVIDEGETVGVLTAHETDTLASGTELWSTESSTTARVVETAVATADQDQLALGTVVDVEFADGSIVTGTVTDVASSTTTDPTDPEAESTLAVEISLDDVPESAADLVEVDVTIKLVDELAADVVIVPVGALVARGDGVFAVEAVTTTGTTFVEVEPGMFDDGFVEVTGLQAGAQVVVP